MYADITEKLRGLGCLPLSSATLDGILANFRSPKDKVSYMVKQGADQEGTLLCFSAYHRAIAVK